MDIRLREIAGGPAGTYFIVTDNSTVEDIQTISNLRLIPINVEQGPVNAIVVFQKGDTYGFTSIFGKGLRKHEKQGNFSIKTCLKALKAGPIAVMNMRAFDSELDKIGIEGLSPNKTVAETKTTSYQDVFNINGLWAPKAKNIINKLDNENLLNFANIGKGTLSYFVTVSKNIESLTDQGNETLASTELEIEDFPALTSETILGDTFVDVWIFNNSFNAATVSTNQYYGQLFNQTGLINYDDLEKLSLINEAGFNRKITGSLIPFLKNEFGEDISIDTLINSVYAETGLMAYINDDVLEQETVDSGLPVINTVATGYYTATGTLSTVGNLFSHRLQPTTPFVINLSTDMETSVDKSDEEFIQVTTGIFGELEDKGNQVIAPYSTGIRAGNVICFTDADDLSIKEVTVMKVALGEGENESILTLSGKVNADSYFRRLTPKQNKKSKLAFSTLAAYTPRVEQFTNGSAQKQSEILDVMNSPSVLKGLKNFSGVRYIVDAFKSFVEGSYKYQFGQLAFELDKCNKFVRCFINEPFIEDLEKSTNPLFKQAPNLPFDLSMIAEGGNPSFSTNFLTKFSTGSELCFYFGSGSVVGPNVEPLAAEVSNQFIVKTFAWDVVANESGFLDGITSIEINPDDAERKALEKFRWNPIIKLKSGFTVYGNSTGIKKRSALQQIHNSELLAYIKESLYNMSQSENFKKGTYDEYLRLETQVQSFMDSLAQQGAIQPNPVVQCNAGNNTREVSKQKIKLCRVEYFNIDALDKVVFDLQLN